MVIVIENIRLVNSVSEYFSLLLEIAMTILDVVMKLTKEHNMTLAELERQLGFSRGSIAKMKTSKPSTDRVQKIADYFNVSLEYLMTGKEITYVEDDFLSTLTPQERDEITRLYQKYQNASPEVRSAVELLLKAQSQES